MGCQCSTAFPQPTHIPAHYKEWKCNPNCNQRKKKKEKKNISFIPNNVENPPTCNAELWKIKEENDNHKIKLPIYFLKIDKFTFFKTIFIVGQIIKKIQLNFDMKKVTLIAA